MPPAAVRRHPKGKYLDHEGINGKSFFRSGTHIGGINTGFVLLGSSAKDLHRMEFQLQKPAWPQAKFRSWPARSRTT